MNILTNFPIIMYQKNTFIDLDKNINIKYNIIKNDFGGFDSNIYTCEWVNIYGYEKFLAKAYNVELTAKIRMYYNPNLYNLIENFEIYIMKFKNEPNGFNLKNSFITNSNIDNIREENRLMEFTVKRYIQK